MATDAEELEAWRWLAQWEADELGEVCVHCIDEEGAIIDSSIHERYIDPVLGPAESQGTGPTGEGPTLGDAVVDLARKLQELEKKNPASP